MTHGKHEHFDEEPIVPPRYLLIIFGKKTLISSIQIDKPVHITGQSRVDTWQTSKTVPRSTRTQIINRPMQVEAKSRIDTWQTSIPNRKASQINQVQITFISTGKSLIFT